jgi:hypothetical protein
MNAFLSLSFLLFFLAESNLLAQERPAPSGPMGAIGGLAGFGPQVPTLSYEGSHIAESESGNSGPVVNENSLGISMPVFKSEKETVSLALSGSTLHFGEELTLDSGTTVPNDFYKAEAGLQYSRRLEEKGKSFGLRGTVGYAGDKINDRTQSFNFIANYSFPGSEGGQWVTMLYISNNGPFGAYVPIPGFFYMHRTPAFTGLFGLPLLSMHWTPVTPWAFSFSLFGTTVKTEAAYGAMEQIQFFTGLGFKQQKFLLSNRVEEKDRYTIEEKNAEIGFRKPLYENVFSEFKAGYVFDRTNFIGQGLTDKDGGSIALDQSYYFKWSARVMIK